MGFLSGLKIVRVCLTVAAPSASTAAIFFVFVMLVLFLFVFRVLARCV